MSSSSPRPEDLVFTRHAREQMSRRKIAESLVIQVIEHPDSAYERADGCTEYVAEVDGRTYEVVVAEEASPRRVVTVYEWDGERSRWPR